MSPIPGVRVIEISNFITPYAGMLLADLGAEVIKVEISQRGDPFPSWNHETIARNFAPTTEGKKA
jgi:crotonobetainyl-CoA:carnitine CoA-transferase CaiB-like acyl-CoA transferase